MHACAGNLDQPEIRPRSLSPSPPPLPSRPAAINGGTALHGLSLPAGLPSVPMQTDLDVRGDSGIGDLAPLLAAESVSMEDLVAVELRVRCLEARHGQIHPQVCGAAAWGAALRAWRGACMPRSDSLHQPPCQSTCMW